MIGHSRPTINGRDIASAIQVLRSGYVANGPACRKFERSFSKFIGVSQSAAVASGTAALHLALSALDAGPGDEIIIPSFVCSSVLNAVSYTGATARLADIGPEGFNLSLDDVKKRRSKRTKAVILPHLFGKPAEIRDFLKLGIPVIENCAHSAGAGLRGKRLGSFGSLSVFSFYATKMLTTGYGGMVCSDNALYMKRIKDLIENDERPDYKVRYNYKMSDVSAALGLSQLKRLDSFIGKRRKLSGIYGQALSRSKSIDLPSGEGHIYFRYVIRIMGDIERFIDKLAKGRIEAKRPVFKPLHRYLGLRRSDFPNTEAAYRSAVSLPIYPMLSGRQAGFIAEAAIRAVE